MFHLTVHIKSKEVSSAGKIRFHLDHMSTKCPDEPGCIHWKAYQEKPDKGEFLIVETWDSEADWKNHLEIEPFKNHYEKGIRPHMKRDLYFVEPVGAGR